ncbi:TetR family transcriptional regulator [Pyxidicoccus parkwayensis]|uniref:TetR family transcriptional regulator n=1 Tax=Pyxidicoccus parkwayensis TaxID=2813578 RepID=A0ABX7NQN4_9BACT|nr:TetR family transcriptional regulator [Pyxidicoccus parkwaysis]QSQ20679.1 TetR family transcriptional regulator [Pyxidicoccus parkwaysis]
MVRDAAATRSRILDAAFKEFATYGLAGARIDRIAEAAAANKRSIYVYFEHKEGLFNAVMRQVVEEVSEAVPLDVEDLPGYAGRLFDYWLAHPEVMRLMLWIQLERPAESPEGRAAYRRKVESLTRTKGALPRGISATDLIVMVMGLTNGWFLVDDSLRSADGADPHAPERIARHRAALVEAVRRICA